MTPRSWCRLERREDLLGDLEGLLLRQRPFALDALGEALPLEELHDLEGLAVVEVTEVEDLDDVRVAERARDPRLAQEAPLRLGPRIVAAVEDLERDGLADALVHGAEDGAHAAAADQLLDAVLALDELTDEGLQLFRVERRVHRFALGPGVEAVLPGVVLFRGRRLGASTLLPLLLLEALAGHRAVRRLRLVGKPAMAAPDEALLTHTPARGPRYPRAAVVTRAVRGAGCPRGFR